jgi:hypothetical protein
MIGVFLSLLLFWILGEIDVKIGRSNFRDKKPIITLEAVSVTGTQPDIKNPANYETYCYEGVLWLYHENTFKLIFPRVGCR